MKNSKLGRLLSLLEKKEETDSHASVEFTNVSDSLSRNLIGGNQPVNSNATCSNNTGCTNNENCSGNHQCNANNACGSNTACGANNTCV